MVNSFNWRTIMRVLVVEDEPKVAQAVKEGLEDEKFEVEIAETGEEGFFLVNARTFDVVILDIMLPGRDGFDILKTIRSGGLQTPVLILTALDSVEDKVRGLEYGADDYLAKPFAFAELLARVRTLLRRGRPERVLRLKANDLEMDMLSRAVSRGGTEIALTHREFELLEYLLRNKNQVVTRNMLARDVWHETSRATPLDNVIDVHIMRIRKKIDSDVFTKKLIVTIRGEGFMLKESGPLS